MISRRAASICWTTRGSRSSFWSAAFCSASSWSIRRSSTWRLADAACAGGRARCWLSRKLIWWTVISSLFTLAAVCVAGFSLFRSQPASNATPTARASARPRAAPLRRAKRGHDENCRVMEDSLVGSAHVGTKDGGTAECMAGGKGRPGPCVQKYPAGEFRLALPSTTPANKGALSGEARASRAPVIAAGSDRSLLGRRRRCDPQAGLGERADLTPPAVRELGRPGAQAPPITPCSLPVPPQRRQAPSPVPVEPAGASSPGFMSATDAVGRDPSAGPAGRSAVVAMGGGRRLGLRQAATRVPARRKILGGATESPLDNPSPERNFARVPGL